MAFLLSSSMPISSIASCSDASVREAPSPAMQLEPPRGVYIFKQHVVGMGNGDQETLVAHAELQLRFLGVRDVGHAAIEARRAALFHRKAAYGAESTALRRNASRCGIRIAAAPNRIPASER